MVRGARVADEAVRAYMEALQDPNTAVDWDEVEELANQITETADPIRRVLLRADWRRASDPATYMPDLEADFIAFAAQWAAANRVTGDDFFYEGVALQVLREAGLAISDEAMQYADTDADVAEPPAAVEPEESVAAPMVEDASAEVPLFERGSAMEKVYEAIGEEPFTINELVDRADTSRTTVRAVLDKLDELGRLEELSAVDTGGAGRAPKRFQVV